MSASDSPWRTMCTNAPAFPSAPIAKKNTARPKTLLRAAIVVFLSSTAHVHRHVDEHARTLGDFDFLGHRRCIRMRERDEVNAWRERDRTPHRRRPHMLAVDGDLRPGRS